MPEEESPFNEGESSPENSRTPRKPPEKLPEKKEEKRNYARPDPHRLLPQSADGEKGVLSSMLIAPQEVCGLCIEKHITKDFFFIPCHALIYENIIAMWDRHEPIDFISLTQTLRDTNKLDLAGGAAFITELFTFLPTAANAGYYIDIITEKYLSREVVKVCTEFAARGYDEQDNVTGLIDKCEEAVLGIRNSVTTASKIITPKAAMVSAIGRIEEMYAGKGKVSGLPTGFPDLDKKIDGLLDGQYYVFAARPSQGKTALAMSIAEHLVLDVKVPVAVFSLEMAAQELWQRALCSRARVNLARVRDGFLAERDFPAIQAAAAKIAESKWIIDDTGGLTIQELRARARRYKLQYGIRAIFVDYLQLLTSNSRQAVNNREREVSEVSTGLKWCAKELGLPVVVLCQVGRDVDKQARRPRLSDLRESGSIEQDADFVGFIDRPETRAETFEEKKELEGKADLIIAKQRNGELGDVPLTFLKEYTRFESRAICDDSVTETDAGQGNFAGMD